MGLSVSTALRDVEVALKDAILLSIGQRITQPGGGPFPDPAALRALPAAFVRHDELAFVAGKGVTYQFNRYSTAADDADLVIAPSDATTAGRWMKTSSTVAVGYAKQVRVHTGTDDYLMVLGKGNAARPSVHILFDNVTPTSRSLSKGTLYQMAAHFRIFCVGSNLRAQAQSSEGSLVPAETDPGAHQIAGDVIGTVAGSDLGVEGVGYCDIEQDRYIDAPEAGRLYVESVGVVVFYTVHMPDDPGDLVTLDEMGGLRIQRALLGGGSAYDANNVIRSGYGIPVGPGFTKTPDPGVAVVNGQPVTSAPAAVTFPPNADTYRDLHVDGTFSYTSVRNGMAPPPLVHAGDVANTIRAAATVTDGVGVIYDAMLASTLINYQGVDVVQSAGWSITAIAVTPIAASFTVGQLQQFTATATYSDGRKANISKVCDWTSSDPSVATIGYAGLATWTGAGTTTIGCSYDGLAAINAPSLTGT